MNVDGEEEETVQAHVSPRISGFTLFATALAGACGGASVICTSSKSSGVAVLERGTAGGFVATAGVGASVAVGPAKVSEGCAAATVPVDDGGAESAM